MSDYKKYTELDVWVKTRELTKVIYIITNTKPYPKEELFGLVSQMRRAAVSISSNIAEGCGRQHTKESLQFFYISRGSLYELGTQIYLSFDLEFVLEADLRNTLQKIEDCKKVLNGFIRYYQKLITNNEQPTTNN